MIEFAATGFDGATMTIYSGSYRSPTDNTDYGLGTCNRVEVTSPDGDRLCCDLTPTSQAGWPPPSPEPPAGNLTNKTRQYTGAAARRGRPLSTRTPPHASAGL